MTLKACLQKGSQKKTLEELTIEQMPLEERRREREDKERLKSRECGWGRKSDRERERGMEKNPGKGIIIQETKVTRRIQNITLLEIVITSLIHHRRRIFVDTISLESGLAKCYHAKYVCGFS